MEQKTDRLHPSAPSEKISDLEQRIEKNLNDVNSFKNSINNIKEKITNFKDKNYKSDKKYIKHETLSTILKSFDTFVIMATTSSSITLSLTEVDLIVIPIRSDIVCGLTITNKKLYEIVMEKYSKYKN